MKRLLLAMCLVIVVAFAFYGTANAVGGVCSNCHTMHNSQDGAAVVAAGPQEVLLRAANECLGCHTGTAVPTAPSVDGNGYNGVGTVLSGGSFADSYATSDAKTHNVADLVSLYAGTGGVDNALGDTPPGSTFGALGAQLKCGGANGCHGDHTAGNLTSTQGLKGFHHAAKTTYKFLKIAANNSGAGTNVAGTASADYEASATGATNHNIYAAGGADSISLLCNNCHNDFHGTGAGETGGSASPWKRHPTDFALTAAMASATIDYVNTPFAFTAADRASMATTNATGYTAALGQVMCLSCHRAHASNQNDLLRFDYSTMNAGGGGTTGCLACHVNQR